MPSITLTAPAKVNLFLKVLGRRRDGYHNIHTIFEKISLADKITITSVPHGIKVLSDKVITRNPEDNIAYKAAELVIREFKISSGVSIYIRKKIPMAAGLGGGSSDAASVLMGMDRLFGLRISKSRMIDLAAKLGADVPFFVLGAAFATGKGIGEKLKPLNMGRKLWHLLVFPGFESATKEVYEAFDRLDFALTGHTGDVKIGRLFQSFTVFKVIEAMLYNDLQCAAISEKKVLGSIIERLTASLGKKVVLSGSGSSVFCLYRTGKEAVKAKARIYRSIPAVMRKHWDIFVVQTEKFEE
ncbi:MAG: 4-(cytidine 5'-diphospho)-2-C-methyl-D-erythritol kinase [Candidatus Omnitrophica bacterium]|nr:4-(cytidine 5'-diphospho)-2-C-methyl-D-erythritol kinase [Candidatus Omnitrophota bacterium]